MMRMRHQSTIHARKRDRQTHQARIIKLYVQGTPRSTIYSITDACSTHYYAALKSAGRSRYQAMRRLRTRNLRNQALELCLAECTKRSRLLSQKEITKLVPREKRQRTPVGQLRRMLRERGFKRVSSLYSAPVDGRVVRVSGSRYSELARQVQHLYAQGKPFKEIEHITGFDPFYICRAIQFGGDAHYKELRTNRKQAQLNNAVRICLPECKKNGCFPSLVDIAKLVPKDQRHGVDLREVRDKLMEYGYRSAQSKRKHTHQDLLQHLVDLSKKLGRTPMAVDLRKAKKYHPCIYLSYFGGLVRAQLQVGLKPNRRGRKG